MKIMFRDSVQYHSINSLADLFIKDRKWNRKLSFFAAKRIIKSYKGATESCIFTLLKGL